jgi:DNA-binding Lrp family transcriptional regulator
VDHRIRRLGERPHPWQQFKARFLKTSEPTSVEGIEKYLASGMIRGIGPAYAKRLLRAFGEKVFDVIGLNKGEFLAHRNVHRSEDETANPTIEGTG